MKILSNNELEEKYISIELDIIQLINYKISQQT